ncbi:MAG TPA: hypothetical protein P5328_00175 [Candidatus Paceibacterota bacterium]|nr:hypothetical protein [Candidatus Paceibacterota bacterium]HRZ34256.1 hypothetical protein [Candidatus Paceibacterota bacterium]
MLEKVRSFLRLHPNLDLILSGISLVYIWRGVWSLTDMFTFGTFQRGAFWSYLIPLVIAFAYIYLNDYRLKELIHTD